MTDSLVQPFILETRDHLEEAHRGLLALDQSPDDGPLLNAVFRNLNTIKGTSGIFPKFTPISSMTLSAVNFMDRVRGDEIPLTREMIDLFLNVLDLVGDWLDCIRETGAPPGDAEKLSCEIQTRFDALAAKT